MYKLKKILTVLVTFFLVLSNLQIGFLYAQNVEEKKQEVNQEKEKSEKILNKVETTVVKIADNIEKKVKNEEIKERL
jgi:hypothetical protein